MRVTSKDRTRTFRKANDVMKVDRREAESGGSNHGTPSSVLITCDTCRCLCRHEKSGLCQTTSYDWVQAIPAERLAPAGELIVELWSCQRCGSERVYGIAPSYEPKVADDPPISGSGNPDGP